MLFLTHTKAKKQLLYQMLTVCYRQFVFVNCLWLLYRQTSCNKCPSAPH